MSTDAGLGYRFKACIRKPDVDCSLAANCIEQSVAGDFLLAQQISDDASVGKLLDALNLFAEAHCDATVAQVITEGLYDLPVGKLEQPIALFNQSNADAENGKHACVFDTDDAAPDYDEGPRQLRDVEDLVAVDDGAPIDGDFAGDGGLGADGDYDAIA